MAWGALMGLGNGLQQVGSMLEDKSKREVAEKLAREREDRSEDRLRAKEDRQVARENAAVARVGINPTTGMKEFFNRNEELLRAEPASAYELDSLKLAQQKEQAGLAKVLADTQYSQVRANTAAGKAELDQQLLRARIGTEGARQGSLNRANRSGGSSTGATTPVGKGEAVNQLIKDFQPLIRSMTQEDEMNPEQQMSMEEIYDLANRSIDSATGASKDVGDTFRRALTNYRNSRSKPSPK